MLTNISHPIIIGKVLDIIKASGNYVIDAPLLFESGLDRECDTTIGVICGDEKRATRVAKRDGIDLRYAEMRTSSQKNVDFYREKCVYIIENDGSVADLEKKVKTLLSGLEK